jgi:hypothetical protein
MTPARLLAVGFIFVCTAIAWSALGGSIVHRTGESDAKLAREVARLWGGQHEQLAPEPLLERPRMVKEDVEEKDEKGKVTRRQITKTVIDRVPLPLLQSRVQVELHLDPRQKGLLWYDTYGVGFQGRYRVRNPDTVERTLCVRLGFPSTEAIYDGFAFRLNGQDAPATDDLSKGLTGCLVRPPGGEVAVEVGYRSRGFGPWAYAFGAAGVREVRDFTLEMTTDFRGIDFPAGTLSPTAKTATGNGWRLLWQFESLVTGQKVGLDPPNRLNPGPLAARITFFAPVSLLFFLTVMLMLGVRRGQSLHPMNYFLLSAAFFSFHLLLAYLVDHVNVHVSFSIAAVVSLFLVVTYLRLVGGWRLALVEAGVAQLVFLVLFSYAFFFEGFTGLTVTVGAVLTLFVLMQLTGRVDWSAVFARGSLERSRQG